jgi:ABC-type lipoprotein release transport system permease subunit
MVVPALFDRMTWRLAWRNVGRNPRRTVIVLSAIAVGIWGVFLTMALNFGMMLQMVDTAISTDLGHLQVHALGFARKPGLELRIEDGSAWGARHIDGLPGLRAWAPRLRSEGLLYSPRASVGVRVLAVDPQREPQVSRIPAGVVSGDYFDGPRRRVVIGEALARRLGVGLGNKLVLSVQDAEGEMTGEAYRVGGLFRSGWSEIDRGVVFLRLDEAQALFAVGDAISEIVVVATERDEVESLRDAIAPLLGADLEVKTWKELRPLLDYMVSSFDQSAWWVYAAVFIAMAFGIANVLLMSVYERIREIGVLTAIGMRPQRLVAMILAESLVLALLGLVLGLAAAFATAWALRGGIDLSAYAEGLNAYGIGTRIVPVIRSQDVATPVGVALLTALLASLWPALHAVRIRPAEAVRRV